MIALTTVLGYSQNWQPTDKGLLISYPLMDSISVKLIHRKYLINSAKLTDSLIVQKDKKINIQQNTINNLKEMAKNSDLMESHYNDIIIQKDIILQQERKKARKRQLYAFGSGLIAGIVTTLILIH